MRLFAVNSSPRKNQGNTDRILQPFLEGANAYFKKLIEQQASRPA